MRTVPADRRRPDAPPAPPSTADLPAAPADGLWSPERRRLTAALVLTITLVAFESLAVATVMPVVADDIGGLGLYGWVFSAFFLGSLLGIVLAGWAADRRGTRPPFAAGLLLFTAGLLVGGMAPTMGVLVGGRVLQGVGAGVIPAVAYATVARSYPPELRPRVFAVFSSAWVVPGLVGPAAATGIEHATSWRVVFLALVPLVALAAAMVLPVLSDRAPVPAGRGGRPGGPEPGGGGGPELHGREAGVLVTGVAAVLAGLGARPVAAAVALVVAGATTASWAFVRLVPPGTVRLRAGLPATVAARGILTFAFFGTDAYVSLAVTEGHGAATWVGGLALTCATLAWTVGAWVQQRLVLSRGPRWLVRRGFGVVATGIGLMLLSLLPGVPVGATVLAWGIGGLGMGLSYAPISVTVLASAEPGGEGRASAALQLTDVLGVSLGTGVTGAFVALGDGRGWATSTSLTAAFLVTVAVAAGGVAAAARLPRHLAGVEPSGPG